jgi:hypothetical protein
MNRPGAASLIVISMVLMTHQVSAEIDNQRYHALGVGVGVSCGAWQEARRARNVQAIGQESWVLGYVSASNAFAVATTQNDFLAAVDAEAIWAWLDNYCRQHPLEKLAKATDALIVDLMRKAASEGTKTK